MKEQISPLVCEEYRKSQENRINNIEDSIRELKKTVNSFGVTLGDYVKRVWFFWIAGAIGFSMVTIMTMFYSELRAIGSDMTQTKIDIAVIKSELKIADIQ